MHFMEISDFKDVDICNIIEVCAKAEVSELDFGLLKIKFKSAGTPVPNVWPGMSHTPIPELGTASEPVKPLEISEEDREFLRELEDTQTMMDDPEQWEQNIIDSYLQRNDGVVDERSGHNQAESDLS